MVRFFYCSLLLKSMGQPHPMQQNDKLSSFMPCPGGQLNFTPSSFSSDDYDDVYEAVKGVYSALPEDCDGTLCLRADFVGCTTRLAAHDFLDTQRANAGPLGTPGSDPVGGMDGCIPLTVEQNAGLPGCLNEFNLRGAYASVCSRISLPDFLVLAAETVMSISATCEKSTKHSFKYNYRSGRRWCGSRVDDPNSRQINTDVQIPTMQMLYDHGLAAGGKRGPNHATTIEFTPVTVVERLAVALFFDSSNPYGLPEENTNEDARDCNETYIPINDLNSDVVLAAALFGGHTLGKMEKDNSGYAGYWSNPWESQIFNNNFYKGLLYKGWEPEAVTVDPNCKPFAPFTSGNGFTTNAQCKGGPDNTVAVCGSDTTRCPSERPYCDTALKCCVASNPPLRNLSTTENFLNPGCTKSRYQWSRSDQMKLDEVQETNSQQWGEAMLNVDIILAHNYSILAEDSKCCAFFDEEFLIDNGLEADKDMFCGSSSNCCSKFQNKCNEGTPKGVINAGKAPSYADSLSYIRGPYIDAPYSSHILKSVAEEWNASSQNVKGKPQGVALDAIIAFAKSETLWLKYFHKAWYLATTSGQVNLNRIETLELVETDGDASTECFSWGCEQFTDAIYYNEGWKNHINKNGTKFNVCESYFEEETCATSEFRLASNLGGPRNRSSAPDLGTSRAQAGSGNRRDRVQTGNFNGTVLFDNAILSSVSLFFLAV